MLRQQERVFLVEVDEHEARPRVDLAAEGVHGHRWWTLEELEATSEVLVPRRLPELLRDLLVNGPPAAPIDAGI